MALGFGLAEGSAAGAPSSSGIWAGVEVGLVAAAALEDTRGGRAALAPASARDDCVLECVRASSTARRRLLALPSLPSSRPPRIFGGAKRGEAGD